MSYILIGSILLALTLLVTRVRSVPVRLIYGMTWFLVLIDYVSNRPTVIIAGSSLDVAVIVLLIGIALIICFWAFTNNVRVEEKVILSNGSIKNVSKSHNIFEVPSWIKGVNSTGNNEDFATRFKKTYSRDEYRERNHRALFLKENKKR